MRQFDVKNTGKLPFSFGCTNLEVFTKFTEEQLTTSQHNPSHLVRIRDE